MLLYILKLLKTEVYSGNHPVLSGKLSLVRCNYPAIKHLPWFSKSSFPLTIRLRQSHAIFQLKKKRVSWKLYQSDVVNAQMLSHEIEHHPVKQYLQSTLFQSVPPSPRLTQGDRYSCGDICSIFVSCDVGCCRHVLPGSRTWSQALFNEPHLQLALYSKPRSQRI